MRSSTSPAKTLAITIAIASAIALAGCSANASHSIGDEDGQQVSSSSSSGNQPAAEPAGLSPQDVATYAEKALSGVKPGTELTKDQVAILSKGWMGDLKAYKTTSGKNVLIDDRKALPKNVKADMGKRAAAAASNPKLDAIELSKATHKVLEDLEYDTGRNVVIVVRNYGIHGSTNAKSWAWGTTAPLENNIFWSEADAYAHAKAWVEAQKSPSSYDIVVTPK